MQDRQEQGEADGLFGRWRARLAQALLREPSVVLIERDADALFGLIDPTEQPQARETVN
ncbi:hypothetical protein [Sphingobium sp. WCS2017Hpa-17]|uniref:hypothetical protein n=1 Tax=Sphingobium sp. WCS2017Hpa-17 TaxID=3073638 RepID=UPI00288AAF7B|nr:hypothetical protein [Sphingobium sp. WCS2017Hpa-17]